MEKKVVEITKPTEIKGKKDKGSGENFETMSHLKSEYSESEEFEITIHQIYY